MRSGLPHSCRLTRLIGRIKSGRSPAPVVAALMTCLPPTGGPCGLPVGGEAELCGVVGSIRARATQAAGVGLHRADVLRKICATVAVVWAVRDVGVAGGAGGRQCRLVG